jgi:hypothetical protein
MHLDAPKEAGGEVQGAKEQGHQLGQAYCGRIDVQIRFYESAMRAYRHIQRCGTSISWALTITVHTLNSCSKDPKTSLFSAKEYSRISSNRTNITGMPPGPATLKCITAAVMHA